VQFVVTITEAAAQLGVTSETIRTTAQRIGAVTGPVDRRRGEKKKGRRHVGLSAVAYLALAAIFIARRRMPDVPLTPLLDFASDVLHGYGLDVLRRGVITERSPGEGSAFWRFWHAGVPARFGGSIGRVVSCAELLEEASALTSVPLEFLEAATTAPDSPTVLRRAAAARAATDAATEVRG
jgi:hypothetical protein